MTRCYRSWRSAVGRPKRAARLKRAAALTIEAVGLALVILLAAPVWAAPPATSDAPPGATPQVVPAPANAQAENAADPKAEKPPSDAAADAFLSRCSGCHTVGGGALKGPDLLPATQWPEATLTGAVKRMEKNVGPLPDADISVLVKLLRDPKVRPRLDAERKRSVAELAARLDAPNKSIGAALFRGETAFANGGLACGSCHRAGETGGTLGPDLTALKDKMPRIAMISAFEKTNFKVMRAAYKDHPITKQEAVHLAAFFEDLSPPETAAKRPEAPWLGGAGGGLAIIIVLLIGFATRNRGLAGVRARLVRDAQRS